MFRVNDFDKSYLKAVESLSKHSTPETSDRLISQYNRTHEKTEAVRDKLLKTVSFENLDLDIDDLKTKREVYRYLLNTTEDLVIIEKINNSLEKAKIIDVSRQIKTNIELVYNSLLKDSINLEFILDEMRPCPELFDRVLDYFALKNPMVLAVHFQKFDVKDEEKRIELATIIAEAGVEVARELANNFEKFGVNDEEKRTELAVTIAGAGKDPAKELAENFEKFDIKDEEKKGELATIIAEAGVEAARALAKNFEKFGIKDEEKRIELAVTIAGAGEYAARVLANNFEKFGIKDEEKKIELAVTIAGAGEYAARELANNFEKFGVNDEEKKIELAATIAGAGKYAARELANNFEKFGVNDEEKRTELAVTIAKSGKWGAAALAANFEKFGVNDEEKRIELATIIAKSGDLGGRSLAINFSKFDITDEEKKGELATIIVEDGVEAARALAKNFEKFGIEDEEKNVELATAIAGSGEDPAKELAINFSKFDITDEEKRAELATTIAKSGEKAAESLAANFKKFDIADQETRVQYAKQLASSGETCAFIVLLNLVSFDISDDEKIDIINFIRKKYREVPFMSDQIVNVKTEETKESLYPLFLVSSKSDLKEKLRPKNLEEALGKLDLSLHIVKLKEEIGECNDQIRELEDRKKEVQKQLQAKGMSYKQIKKDNEFKKLQKNVTSLKRKKNTLTGSFEAYENVENDLNTLKVFFEPSSFERPKFEEVEIACKRLRNVIHENKDIRDKKALVDQVEKMRERGEILQSVFFCLDNLGDEDLPVHNELVLWSLKTFYMADQTPQIYNDPALAKVIKQIFNVRNQSLRNQQTELYTSIAREHLSSGDEKLGHLLMDIGSPPYMANVKLSLHSLKNQKGKVFDEDIIKKITKKRRFLEDGEKLLVLLQNIKHLEFSSLSDDKIKNIFNYLFDLDDNDLLNELRSLNSILSLNTDENLKVEKGKKGQFLDYLIESFDQLDTGIVVKDREKFVKRFFGDRSPGALAIYVSGILKLSPSNKKGVLNELSSFVNQVENGTFQTKRYEDSEHLSKLFAGREELKRKWKEGASGVLKDYLVEDKENELLIVDSDNPLDLFLSGTEVGGSCQRVDGDPDLNMALMGYVMDGKHRILAIKNEKGEIVGRLILRLLAGTNERGEEEPVLFFERIYPNTLQPAYQEALKQFAIERSEALGLKLISKETPSDKRYTSAAKSLSSKAPFEYCDGSGGIQSRPYEIRGCYLITDLTQ